MNALFRWLDVDLVQWRALLRASLRSDFAAVQLVYGARKSRWSSLFMVFVLYLLAGISPAIIAAASSDVLLSATVMVTVVGFMVLSSLLVGEGTTILSPQDHQVIGFRPVTSRTYFAVRVASLLVRTAIISTCVALAPVIVLLTKDGLHVARGVASLVASWSAAVAVTLAIVAMYGWLLKLAGPHRMTRYASYVQFAAQMVVWGGFVLVTQDLFEQQLAGASLSGTPLALAYPGAWFGSYVAIAEGAIGVRTLVPAALSLVLIAVLWRTIAGKLSLGYAESVGRVAAVAVRGASREARPRRWQRLLDDESRAMAILVRSHMRYDIKFRLGVISLIPITLLYVFMGGWPNDPFVQGASRADDSPVIQMALLFLPATLRRVLVTSERWRASWIFLAAPADGARLVLAARNIIVLFFLLPYLLFIVALLVYSFGSLPHALLHTAFMGLVAYVALQFMVMMNPQLPFSLPAEKDAQSGAMFGVMIVVVFVGIAMFYLLTRVVYQSATRMVVATVVFALLAWGMDRLTRVRAKARLARSGVEG